MSEQFGAEFDSQGHGQIAPKKKGFLGPCLIGCGVVALVVLIIVAIGGFWVWKNSSMTHTDDPAAVDQIASKIVEFTTPEGYQGVMAGELKVFGVGGSMAIYAQPEFKNRIKDGKKQDDRKLESTVFIFFSIPQLGSGDLRTQFNQQSPGGLGGQQGKLEDMKTVDLDVGGVKRKMTRAVNVQNGNKTVTYQAILKPGVLFSAAGPEETFDQKAFESLLKSMKNIPAEDSTGGKSDKDGAKSGTGKNKKSDKSMDDDGDDD